MPSAPVLGPKGIESSTPSGIGLSKLRHHVGSAAVESGKQSIVVFPSASVSTKPSTNGLTSRATATATVKLHSAFGAPPGVPPSTVNSSASATGSPSATAAASSSPFTVRP